MTEQEWQTGDDPVALLAHLNRPPGDRKLRLYAVACCRERWQLLPEQASRDGVEWAERFADGVTCLDTNYERLDWASEGAFLKYEYRRARITEQDAEWGEVTALAEAAYLANAAMYFDQTDDYKPDFRWHRRMLSIDLIRDIFGNPFRPVAFDPSWRTSTVLALAQQMYESRDFSPMPILADALQDAGCEHADILAHCRADSPHVRGCWVVDLVLGKS